ncbi:magnesium transporter NIPA-domain-containing protein [Umbelopsis sp. PMI_123]|nr:magnesium transporter NIPA-domain-containing protein [Umbelopsis sp. PMI_123]
MLDPPPDNNFWLALSISIATNLIQSFALAIQRKSHILNDTIYPIEHRKNAFRRPLWVAGFSSYLIANIIGSIFTIGYLPIVILAPIGAMGLVFNAIFAKIVLGDPFTRKSVVGTVLIVIGAILVGGFGVVREPNHSLEDLIRLYHRPSFIAYFSVLEFFTVIMLMATHYLEYRVNKIERGILPESKLIKLQDIPEIRMKLGVSYGMLSGNISSQSLLFAKSGLELLILTLIHGQNQFKYFLTWMIVVTMIVMAILQLFYLNKGLRLCDTVILIPLSFCSFNVSCLFNGLVYYNQWERLFWWQILCVMVGIVILVSGVLILSWRTSDLEEPEIVNDSAILPPVDQVDEVTMGGIPGAAASASSSSHRAPAPTEKTRLLPNRRRSTMESDEFYGI